MKRIIVSSLSLLLLAVTARCQTELEVLKGWMAHANAPNSLYDYLAGEAYAPLLKRKNHLAALRTLPQWRQQQQWMRSALQQAVGAFPAKTPLQVKVTRTVRKEGFRVEHLIYESQPGFYVTGSLFIPDGARKAPAVLYCSGHSATGYRSGAYQRVMLNLVKKGFVVFAFDPVGQGERLEYYDSTTRKSRHKWPTNEHSYPGAQIFLTGGTLARYMIWDGIRAIDLLEARPEVDPQRIAVTGRSGGGTQSAYIAAFDDRVKAVAPENYITNFTRLFQSIGPQDAEQNFFKGIARGLDMGDLLMVRAPKPCLMITTTRDIFSMQGAMETAGEVSRLYAAYGQPDNFSMVTDDAAHASTQKNREALYAFLQQQLSHPGSGADEAITPLTDEELRVTPTGQLSTSLHGETLFTLNRKEAEKKHAARRSGAGILSAAQQLSGYRAPKNRAAPVFAGRLQKEGYVIEKAFVQSENGYVIPYLLFKPDNANHRAVLYLHPAGKTNAGSLENIVKEGFTLLAPDLPGTGETGPGAFKGDSYIDSISYNVWFAGIQTGRSIAGIRAGDAAMLARMLQQHYGAQEVYGIAKDDMASVLLHAAAFDKTITRIALLSPGPPWYKMAADRLYDPRFLLNAVAGAIGVYDLPDLAASLAPRRLLITGTAGNKHPLTTAAYQRANATAQLQISTGDDLQRDLAWWLKN